MSQEPQPPNILTQAANFAGSMAGWAAAGFGTVSQEVYEERLSYCRACPYWDPNGMMGTGRCQKCGCSTQAKLRLPTAVCPEGYWAENF